MKVIKPALWAFIVLLLLGDSLGAESSPESIPMNPPVADEVKLESAVMCEEIVSFYPKNAGVVFSVSNEKVICFTRFNPVLEKTFILHRWFHKDRLSTVRKLFLNPPKWASFSGIHLRETDKGPWRVEVTDRNDKVIKILRFSITE